MEYTPFAFLKLLDFMCLCVGDGYNDGSDVDMERDAIDVILFI